MTPQAEDSKFVVANVGSTCSLCDSVDIPGQGKLSKCTPVSRCKDLLDYEDAPLTRVIPCGFDTLRNQVMVCCPEESIAFPHLNYQHPRFPGLDGGARPVEDRHELCTVWKDNGGCDLDKNFIISEVDPYNGQVSSWEMFEFMSITCLKTCGWAESKVTKLFH